METTHLHPLDEPVRDLIPDIVHGPAPGTCVAHRRSVLLHPFRIAVKYLERTDGGGVDWG